MGNFFLYERPILRRWRWVANHFAEWLSRACISIDAPYPLSRLGAA
jgi:hypothetical protein